MSPSTNPVLIPLVAGSNRLAAILGGSDVYQPVTGGVSKEMDRVVARGPTHGRGEDAWTDELFRRGD